MGKTLVVHIGHPKTATKTLQFNVFSSLYHNGKLEYLNHLEKNNKDFGEYSCENSLKYILGFGEYSEGCIKKEQLSWDDIDKQISVVSNEGISHISVNNTKPYHKILPRKNAERIKEIFGTSFSNIRILITIRNQKTIIPSYYTQEYFNIITDKPSFRDFDKWFEYNFNDSVKSDDLLFNYYALYNSYIKVFGQENVKVLFYEDLKSKNIKFFREIGDMLNIDGVYLEKLFNSYSHNVTIKRSDGTQVDPPTYSKIYGNKLNKLFESSINKSWYKKTKQGIKTIVPKKLLNKKSEKNILINHLNESQIKKIENLFKNENMLLESKLSNNSFKNYNYPLRRN